MNGGHDNYQSQGGEKRSRSEQNKERVWAAVTSCLTNVPPTLLGALAAAAAAAAGAAAAPAGGRGEALGSVGLFPSNSRPRARPAPSTSGALPPPGPRAGPLLPRPSPASLLSPPRGCTPECASCPVPAGGTPEGARWGRKDEGTKLPPREAGLGTLAEPPLPRQRPCAPLPAERGAAMPPSASAGAGGGF